MVADWLYLFWLGIEWLISRNVWALQLKSFLPLLCIFFARLKKHLISLIGLIWSMQMVGKNGYVRVRTMGMPNTYHPTAIFGLERNLFHRSLGGVQKYGMPQKRPCFVWKRMVILENDGTLRICFKLVRWPTYRYMILGAPRAVPMCVMIKWYIVYIVYLVVISMVTISNI